MARYYISGKDREGRGETHGPFARKPEAEARLAALIVAEPDLTFKLIAPAKPPKRVNDGRCQRCHGRGGWEGWPGFTCYGCGGSGRKLAKGA